MRSPGHERISFEALVAPHVLVEQVSEADDRVAGLHAVAPLPEEEGVHGSDLDEGPAEDADDRRVAQVEVAPNPRGLGV